MKDRSFLDLRSYISFLRSEEELIVVEAPVDVNQEVAEIHRRVIAADGPALLFTNVEGYSFPVVTNLFGTRKRVEFAFGEKPLLFIKDLVKLLQRSPPSIKNLWEKRDILRSAFRIGTKQRKTGEINEIINNSLDLSHLPILTSWPEDGGPFLTLPLVFTGSPSGHAPNLGIYRMQVHGPNKAGMHWQIGKGGGHHYSLAESMRQPLPVTVFLGGPPSLILAAVAPLPENIPEILMASLILGKKLRMITGLGPHPIPDKCEFALVGKVLPDRRFPEGPFGDHYGYYSLIHDYPVFELQKIYQRRNAIYPATVVGKPRQEDFYIGDFLQELLKPIFPLVMPGVVDIWAYGETGYHSLAAAVVRERYRREAMASAFRILGEGQLSLTKFLFVTDKPVELLDFKATLTHILERTNPARDLYVLSNLAMDTLDYTGPRINEGSKGVWLGLGDPKRSLPKVFTNKEIPIGVDKVIVFCPGCLVIGCKSWLDEPELAIRLAKHPAFADWPLLILTTEAERATASSINFLWTTFTRFEPAANLFSQNTFIDRNHISYEFPIVIDARIKPNYPKELSCSSEISERVSNRWKEYFSARVEMGDAEKGHLD